MKFESDIVIEKWRQSMTSPPWPLKVQIKLQIRNRLSKKSCNPVDKVFVHVICGRLSVRIFVSFNFNLSKLLKKIQVVLETKCLYGDRVCTPLLINKRSFNSFKTALKTFRIIFFNLLGLETNGLSLSVTVLYFIIQN